MDVETKKQLCRNGLNSSSKPVKKKASILYGTLKEDPEMHKEAMKKRKQKLEEITTQIAKSEHISLAELLSILNNRLKYKLNESTTAVNHSYADSLELKDELLLSYENWTTLKGYFGDIWGKSKCSYEPFYK